MVLSEIFLSLFCCFAIWGIHKKRKTKTQIKNGKTRRMIKENKKCIKKNKINKIKEKRLYIKQSCIGINLKLDR